MIMKGELNANEVNRFMITKQLKISLTELEVLKDLKERLGRGSLTGKLVYPDELVNWYMCRRVYEQTYMTLARTYGDELAAKMVLVAVDKRIEEVQYNVNVLKNLL